MVAIIFSPAVLYWLSIYYMYELSIYWLMDEACTKDGLLPEFKIIANKMNVCIKLYVYCIYSKFAILFRNSGKILFIFFNKANP